MSYVMHTKRINCLEFMKRYLKENQKVSKAELLRETMMRFSFSGSTAERYMRDLIIMGFAKLNDDHLVYVEEEKPAKEKQK